jgi:hypothetical protein
MRYVAQPHYDLDPPETCAAPLRGWIAALIAWFCDVFDSPLAQRCPLLRDAIAAAKAQVAADLRRTTQRLRRALIGYAYARMRFVAGRIRQTRYPGRGGERRARRLAHFNRRATAGIIAGMHEGSLRRRVERLAAVLDAFESLIARVVTRLEAIWRFPHRPGLAPAAAHAARIAVKPVCALAAADTS